MILVAGSTGMVGGEICSLLAGKGRSFRALVREATDPFKIARLTDYGAELVKGDLRDRDSIASACRGVDVVICTISSMPSSYEPGANDIQSVDEHGVGNLIATAKAAGVRHFIHTTFSGNIDLEFPLCTAKRAAERRLKESGLLYTILRPSYFMEVWLSPAVGFDAASFKATIYGTGDQRLSWISLRDVAHFAVESLENPMARNRILELGGPESLSPHQVIELFEKAGGRTFEVTCVPLEVLQAQSVSATDPMQESFIGLMRCYGKGDSIDMSEIQKTFAVRLTSMGEYIASVLAKP